jgi:undecaprenyl-phosphate galactose phosphotransferase
MLRHWTIMAALLVADSLAFATGYFLFRYDRQMPAILLPSSAHGPNLASATDIYLIMAGVFLIARYLFGDYGRRQLFWDGARATSSTIALAAIPDILLVTLLGKSNLYLPLAASWLFLLPAIPIYRQLMRRLLGVVGLWNLPTALIGTGRHACDAYMGLRDALSLGFDVRFLVANCEDKQTPPALSKLYHIQQGSPKAVVTQLQKLECQQVIVAAEDALGTTTSEIIQRLLGANINVAIIPFLRGLPLFGLSTNYLFGKDVLILQLRNNLARLPSLAAKRLVDFFGPIVLLVLFSPFLLAFAIAIKMSDGGPVFFVQRRVGRGGREFDCFKFRSMTVNAEKLLADWKQQNPAMYEEYVRSNFKLKNDPRITRVGRWLRRSSFDELPQLLNVLVGHMSLVGPRPLLSREVAEYGVGFELYQRIRPGMTGLWQISGRSETKFSDRASYDEWYVLNWSLWYDAIILIQTAWIVLSGKGAY